jgi:hypothetical protein
MPTPTPESDPLFGASTRRAHDAAAYEAARATTAQSVAVLLAVLLSPDATAAAIEPRARAALSEVGLLWETAARASEA